MMSDNEDEKNEKVKIDNETKHIEEKIENEVIPDKHAAYNLFRHEQLAKDIELNIEKNRLAYKTNKDQLNEYKELVNMNKQKCQELDAQLGNKKMNKLNLGDEMTNVIDEEECRLVLELKEMSSICKDYYVKYKNAKTEKETAKNNIDILRLKLMEGFESWFYKRFGIKVEDHELKIRKVK